MPKIQEYQTRTSTQNAVPQGSKAPTGMFDPGARIGDAIQSVAGAADLLLKRASQEDVSNVHVGVAEANQKFTKAIAERAQAGTLNTDDLVQEYADHMDKEVRSKISTPAGEQYYRTQYANQHAELSISSMRAQMNLASDRATANFSHIVNTESSSLIDNPSGFNSAVVRMRDRLKNDVEKNGFPAGEAAKLGRVAEMKYAESEMRGWIRIDPNFAIKRLHSGERDAYISGDLKKQLEGEANTAITARRQEQDRLRFEKERFKKEQQGVYMGELLNRLQQGPIPTKDILESVLDPNQKEHFLAKNESRIKGIKEVNHGLLFQNLYVRANLPDGDPQKLANDQELVQLMGAGKLTTQDVNILRKEISSGEDKDSPHTKALKLQLFNAARDALDPTQGKLIGTPDPLGPQRMANWMSWMEAKKADLLQKGKNINDILTPGDSKFPNQDYLGLGIKQFVMPSSRDKPKLSARFETDIPGLEKQGNINLATRPQVPDPSGKVSTLLSASFNIDKKEVLLPKISEDGRILSDKEAVAEYHKTGKHLGIFKDKESAEAYAKKLHNQQEEMLRNPMLPGETPFQYGRRLEFGSSLPNDQKRRPGESMDDWEKRTGNK